MATYYFFGAVLNGACVIRAASDKCELWIDMIHKSSWSETIYTWIVCVNCKCRFQFYICFWRNPFVFVLASLLPLFFWLFPCTLHYCRKHCGHGSLIVCAKTFLCEHDLATWLMVALLSVPYWTRVGKNWLNWENEGSTVVHTDFCICWSYCSTVFHALGNPVQDTWYVISSVSSTSLLMMHHASHWSFMVF
jgi:hypothetical protein